MIDLEGVKKRTVTRIVTFDPGLNLGYSAGFDLGLFESGHVKNDSKVSIAKRQVYLTKFIRDFIVKHDPDLVVVEGVNRVRGKQVDSERNESTWALYWVWGEILRITEELNIPLYAVNPATMKTAATLNKREPGAKGLAKKEEVAKVVRELFKLKAMRSDESDAIGLLVAFWMLYKGEYVPNSQKKKKRRK